MNTIKMFFTICLMMTIVSCGVTHYEEEATETFHIVEDFKADCLRYSNFNCDVRTTIVFVDTLDTTGRCYHDSNFIVLNRSVYEGLSDHEKVYIVYHELVHCHFHVHGHDKTSGIMSAVVDSNGHYMEHYIKDLFWRVIPEMTGKKAFWEE